MNQRAETAFEALNRELSVQSNAGVSQSTYAQVTGNTRVGPASPRSREDRGAADLDSEMEQSLTLASRTPVNPSPSSNKRALTDIHSPNVGFVMSNTLVGSGEVSPLLLPPSPPSEVMQMEAEAQLLGEGLDLEAALTEDQMIDAEFRQKRQLRLDLSMITDRLPDYGTRTSLYFANERACSNIMGDVFEASKPLVANALDVVIPAIGTEYSYRYLPPFAQPYQKKFYGYDDLGRLLSPLDWRNAMSELLVLQKTIVAGENRPGYMGAAFLPAVAKDIANKTNRWVSENPVVLEKQGLKPVSATVLGVKLPIPKAWNDPAYLFFRCPIMGKPIWYAFVPTLVEAAEIVQSTKLEDFAARKTAAEFFTGVIADAFDDLNWSSMIKPIVTHVKWATMEILEEIAIWRDETVPENLPVTTMYAGEGVEYLETQPPMVAAPAGRNKFRIVQSDNYRAGEKLVAERQRRDESRGKQGYHKRSRSKHYDPNRAGSSQGQNRREARK